MVENSSGVGPDDPLLTLRKYSHLPRRHLIALSVVGSILVGGYAESVHSAPPPPVMDSISTDEVPPFSPGEAWQLAHEPLSRMIDDVTCERIEGTYLVGSEASPAVISGSTSALFRADRKGTPFLRVRTREDGVYVVRFPARPNEVITSRSYRLDPYTKRFVYGEPSELICLAGEVRVGEPSSIPEER